MSGHRTSLTGTVMHGPNWIHPSGRRQDCVTAKGVVVQSRTKHMRNNASLQSGSGRGNHSIAQRAGTLRHWADRVHNPWVKKIHLTQLRYRMQYSQPPCGSVLKASTQSDSN